ncbi:alpha/beta hydrolase [Flectobacillus sp. BAB-3569]|uniref:alpha/beta hydrolase n=1 Tax=Flectobacillus sp. BAB-3569 TaxID=1509483 RepID=UPI001E58E30B|nr:alpha/beta hydrolase-fold protein [Flectobacillus sp. BAB-3569]
MSQSQGPKVSSGKIVRIENFPSKLISARNIDIWLPEGYSNRKKYAVVYMHDGQMLFDSTTTWNKQDWQADEVANKLMKSHKTKDFIIVGIWNGGETRHPDYFPQKPYESLSPNQKAFVIDELKKIGRTEKNFQPVSDNYLKFLVSELKPYIDQNFSVWNDPANTFVAGSSMGGLISMYAICEYPEIFGGAACLSTHWIGIFSDNDNPVPEAFLKYMEAHLPSPKTHKIYFDFGTVTLDAFYPKHQAKVDELMLKKGFTSNNWETLKFEGEDHSEKAWAKRLNLPFEFLLKK